MSLRQDIETLRALEHDLPSRERPTIRIRRDILRAALMQEEGIVMDICEEDTAVHRTPTDEELLMDRELDGPPTKSNICAGCRDRYTDEFYCPDCA